MLAGPTTYEGRYVSIDNVALEFPPLGSIPVVAGVTGPNSLELSGEVAAGTVLPGGSDADQIREAQARIEVGRTRAGRTDSHRLTVFVGYFCGDVSTLPPPPEDVEDDFAIVGPSPDAGIEEFQAILDTGLDSMVLIPFGPAPEQLTLFHEEIAPHLTNGGAASN